MKTQRKVGEQNQKKKKEVIFHPEGNLSTYYLYKISQ
jgi:hypothetical protein